MTRPIQFLLLPLVAVIGAFAGGVISSLAGGATGKFLGQLHERSGFVVYEEESPGFLTPMGMLIGAIGGAIGGTIAAVAGWISKKASLAALLGILSLLFLFFYCMFASSPEHFPGFDGPIIALITILSGPPLVGILAVKSAKRFDHPML